MSPYAAIALANTPVWAVFGPLIVMNRIRARRLVRYERENGVKVFYGFVKTG